MTTNCFCEWPSNAHNVVFFDDVVYTTVTYDPASASQWIHDVNSLYGHRLIVGLDIEWHPNHSRDQQNPAATLQLCVGRCCLIYQLIHSPYFPIQLIQFLSYSDHTFVGIEVRSDLEKLQRDYKIGYNAKAVDLRRVAVDVYKMKELKYAGLKSLARTVLGKEMEKPKRVTRSSWDDRRLTAEQVQYACIDAYKLAQFHITMRIMIKDYEIPRGTHDCYRVTLNDCDEIETLVTHDPGMVISWIDNTENQNSCRLRRLIVGFDVEWRPNLKEGCDHPVATLQLCVGKSCLIFQILRAPNIPRRLREFLKDTDYTFVGVGINSDVRKLKNDHGLEVAKTRDLRSWAANELEKNDARCWIEGVGERGSWGRNG